ncbi:hypothetical protein [Lysobacter gummosus]
MNAGPSEMRRDFRRLSWATRRGMLPGRPPQGAASLRVPVCERRYRR